MPDFVIIVAPTGAILRPVSDGGRAFIHERYSEWPRGIGQCIALSHDALNDTIDAMVPKELRIEVL